MLSSAVMEKRKCAGPPVSLQTTQAAEVVLLGVGNILLTDEGVGVRAIEEIERRYVLPESVRVMDGGTSGMELLDTLAGTQYLIIVDAVKSGTAPGTIVRLAGDDVPVFFSTKLSPHQVGLCDVLATLAVMDESPGETVIIGVEPSSLDLAMELSPAVGAVMPTLVETVLAELKRIGVEAVPRN